jgi:hypothetical protein
MNVRPRASAWIGAATNAAASYYAVELGHLDARGQWQSVTLEGSCDGTEADAAREALLAVLATLDVPSRIGVAVTDRRIATTLRMLVRTTVATQPHEVSVTCVSTTADYALPAAERAERARALARTSPVLQRSGPCR